LGVNVDIPRTTGARIRTQPSDVTVDVAGMFTWREPGVVVVMVDIRVDVRVGTVGNGMLGCLASDVPNEKPRTKTKDGKATDF